MRISLFKIYIVLGLIACQPAVSATAQKPFKYSTDETTLNGAENLDAYIPLIKDKKVAIVANHTSMLGKTHLVDTLVSLKINIIGVFAPEHGFRGMEDAGAKINSTTDEKTGLPIVSLYGKNKKPTVEQLSDVDVVLFDIQDVGARFYTYISTMSYVMEACAENKKKVIVLDRPNPNGHYVDGPVMKKELTSFVGMHPVPVIHGMTVGEYAQMVNGEKWLLNGVQCDLTVIPVKNYDHHTLYTVPIAPSPNLKTQEAIWLYPTTCLFEGTELSVGRGTDNPFTMAGHPNITIKNYSFTPVSMPGSKDPKLKDQKCYGINFATDSKWGHKDALKHLDIIFIMELYTHYPDKTKFFISFFDKLIGNTTVRQMILDRKGESEIRDSWKKEVEDFKVIRKKYLLYED